MKKIKLVESPTMVFDATKYQGQYDPGTTLTDVLSWVPDYDNGCEKEIRIIGLPVTYTLSFDGHAVIGEIPDHVMNREIVWMEGTKYWRSGKLYIQVIVGNTNRDNQA